MPITIDLPVALTKQLQQVDDPSAFIEDAVRRELNRQRLIGKLQSLARNISSRPEARALGDGQLSELLKDL